jgi:hypothetical protein
MRPKFLFALIFFTVLLLGASLFLKHLGSASAPPAASEIATPAPVVATNVATSIAPPTVFVAPAATNALTRDQRQAAIDAERDRLLEWSMQNDPSALSNILADLNSPEKDIREMAIEAAKQFDNTNAIPALKAAVDNTDDTQEKIDLLKAVNFLMVPPLEFKIPTEPLTPEQVQASQQAAAKAAARRQARNQMNNRNQPMQPAPPAAAPDNPPSN